MLKYLIYLIPMFKTLHTAGYLNENNEYEFLCLESEVTPDVEIFITHYGKISCFTWLGFVVLL